MHRWSILTLLVISCLLSACASVSVRKLEQGAVAPPAPPAKIFVKPLAFNDQALRVDRSGERLAVFKFDLQEKFTRNLVKRLRRNVAPTEAVCAIFEPPQGNYWVVTGRFDRVNQGSRLLRALIGYGMGGTKMETTIYVTDYSTKPPRRILTISTTGGSNAMPGGIGTATYFTSGVMALGSVGNLVDGARSGLTFDAIRTTREVTAAISEYLHQSDKAVLTPKREGYWWPFNMPPKSKGSVIVSPAASPAPFR